MQDIRDSGINIPIHRIYKWIIPRQIHKGNNGGATRVNQCVRSRIIMLLRYSHTDHATIYFVLLRPTLQLLEKRYYFVPLTIIKTYKIKLGTPNIWN
uniref:Uncharacterized protein n=1 Tax=Triticum urartu TaxID=4572 RepID=A0A8R7QBB3_TRIUA